MIPGMNSKKMQKMMKQMGIKQEEMSAQRVEITLSGGKKLVFEDPDVSKVDMMGQKMYQLQGTPRTEEIDTTPSVTDDDIETVMEQTGASEEEARQAIDDADGDLAEAIMSLSE